MILAGLAFAAFLINAMVGKVSLLLGMYPPTHLGNIPEVLLLLAAVACFVAGVLEKERAQSPQSRGDEEP